MRSSRSRKLCITCHFYRHRVAADGIPELACELHRALIPQGVHLANRCQGWTDDLVRQQGWAPEVAWTGHGNGIQAWACSPPADRMIVKQLLGDVWPGGNATLWV